MAPDSPILDQSHPVDRAGAGTHGNALVRWDLFDIEDYLVHNYATDEVHKGDAQIIRLIREFFFGFAELRCASGLDVGTGANLYPAMAMMPMCDRITLRDWTPQNVAWLRAHVDESRSAAGLPADSPWFDFWEEIWLKFWRILARSPYYDAVQEPAATLHDRVTIERGSIFELEQGRWDVGTMFFVAESITDTIDEFRKATARFVGALKRDAPFAAAFMRKSDGYTVGELEFPAVSITEADVTRCLETCTRDLTVHVIPNNDLRAGYDGMILATGIADV